MLFVVDLETTHLEPQDGGIWDCAAVAVRDGAIVARFQTLVWPGRRRLRECNRQTLREVSGLTDAEILRLLDEDVPDSVTARNRLIEWLLEQVGVEATWPVHYCRRTGEETPVRLTSYNAGFDSKFLSATPWDLDYFLPAAGSARLEWAPCLMLATSAHLGPKLDLPRRRDGSYRWLKLPRACQEFGIPFEETHRALADAEAAAQLAIRLGVA